MLGAGVRRIIAVPWQWRADYSGGCVRPLGIGHPRAAQALPAGSWHSACSQSAWWPSSHLKALRPIASASPCTPAAPRRRPPARSPCWPSSRSLPAAAKPTAYRPGFNLFCPQQDVEIGRQSAAEAERQLPLLRDRAVDGYLESDRAAARGARPRRAVPVSGRGGELGGRQRLRAARRLPLRQPGHVDAASSEARARRRARARDRPRRAAARHAPGLAGVPGAGRASRCSAAPSPGATGTARHGPDPLGARRAGTERAVPPLQPRRRDAGRRRGRADHGGRRATTREAMATMFDKLQAMQRSQPGRLAQFFSDHPAAGDRAARIRQEAARDRPGIAQRRGGRLRAACAPRCAGGPRAAASASRRARPTAPAGTTRGDAVRGDCGSSRLDAVPQLRPARRLLHARDYPDNWEARAAESGYGRDARAPRRRRADAGRPADARLRCRS